MEGDLFLSAEAELTGSDRSVALFPWQWDDDDDSDSDDDDDVDGDDDVGDAVWAAGKTGVFVWGWKEWTGSWNTQRVNMEVSRWGQRQCTNRWGILKAAVQSGSQRERARLHFLQTLLHLNQPQLHLHPVMLGLPTRLLFLLQTCLQWGLLLWIWRRELGFTMANVKKQWRSLVAPQCNSWAFL